MSAPAAARARAIPAPMPFIRPHPVTSADFPVRRFTPLLPVQKRCPRRHGARALSSHHEPYDAQRRLRPAMTRVPAIRSKEDLDPRHHEVYDAIVRSRGNMRGVFTVLMYSPNLALRASELGDYVRYHSALDPRMAELAVLVVA